MPLKAVFFDIDGTLVDSNEFHVMAWDEAFRDHGHPVPQDQIRVQIGKGADQLIPTLLPDLNEKTRKAIADRHGEIFRDVEIDLRPVCEPWDIGMAPPPPAGTPRRFMLQFKADARYETGAPDINPEGQFVGLAFPILIGDAIRGVAALELTNHRLKIRFRLRRGHVAAAEQSAAAHELQDVVGAEPNRNEARLQAARRRKQRSERRG